MMCSSSFTAEAKHAANVGAEEEEEEEEEEECAGGDGGALPGAKTWGREETRAASHLMKAG
jgi:hypothetical protein